MLQQVSVVAALGVAQTMIILTAGIDLSIGAAMILGAALHGAIGREQPRGRRDRASHRTAGGDRDRGAQRRAGHTLSGYPRSS